MRVLAALSGGVDSSVAAARAVDAGHDVTGVHLALASDPVSHRTGARGCCTLEDARDARRVADRLGIAFYVWDLADRFREDVIDDFIAEYERGRTPNPCLRCNERIKFAAVLDRALALGFDAVCTGHYARLVDDTGVRELHRAIDATKDQSYVLAVLDEQQIAGAMFPLGDSLKSQVRDEAAQRGLITAEKPDSHDICFIPDGDTAGWLREHLGDQPADIVDVRTGEVLASTATPYAVTVGQRRGLDLGRPAPDGAPRYVVDVDLVTRRVEVGPRDLLLVSTISGERVRWCGRPMTGSMTAEVQVRAHGEALVAQVTIEGDRLIARLDEPIAGVARGQALVVYSGTRVLASATIDGTGR